MHHRPKYKLAKKQKVFEETKEITFMTSGLAKSVLAHSKQ